MNKQDLEHHSNDNVLSFVAKPQIGDKAIVNEIQSEDNNSLIINGSTGSPSEQSDNISNHLLNTIKLSSKSRNLLIIRILLLCLGCIFVPMEMILYNKLEQLETHHTYPFIDKISGNFTNSNLFYYISYPLITLLSNKDAIMIYISVIYVVSHPFIALKLVMTTNVIHYVMTIMKCLYQSKRPFWLALNQNKFCYTSFANPSTSFFLVSFFLLYTIVSLNFLKKKSERMKWHSKMLMIICYIILIFISSIIFILNKLNFIYQLTFTLCVSLIIICLLIDFENTIHNYILKSMKNIFKTRKYKIKILFYILALSVIAVIIYFFIVPDNLNIVAENLAVNTNCSKEQKEELGIEYTFMEIPYIFGIIGSFWGASFTIEYECSKWWSSSFIKMIIKVVITIIFSIGYILVFKHVFVHVTYEFDFLIGCLKYLMFYYIVMGPLPMVYHFIGLNEKKKHEEKNFKSLLFTKTIFTDGGNQFENVFYGDSKEKGNMLYPDEEDKKDLNEIKEIKEEEDEDDRSEQMRKRNGTTKSNLYKKSHIIGDIQKNDEEKLEFTIRVDDDYFNN